VNREPYVAGSFYPASPAALQALVDRVLDQATVAATARATPSPTPTTGLRGILVPHAGLEWSGAVAAAGWRVLADAAASPPERAPDTPAPDAPQDTTVVILGTNHSAWLDGVGAWDAGAWRTPLGEVAVDPATADAITQLGAPYAVDPGAHRREHSIEVQLPLLQSVRPGVRIVPLAVSAGSDEAAVDAGVRLGHLIGELDRPARRVLLAISTDLAHYPGHRDCAQATADLLPSILALDPVAVARTEDRLTHGGIPGLVCGMCGIQPTVLGLAALRAMGAERGVALASATSADAGGPPDRTVGYLAVAFA
jgi:AmmeMemoRadiSam system protein B